MTAMAMAVRVATRARESKGSAALFTGRSSFLAVLSMIPD
jgi:hypothetical protein